MKLQKNIALEFNEFSKNYTQDMIGCVPHYLELMESFIKFLPTHFQPKTILDLGSGNGNVSAQLLPYFPDAQYTLVDASAEMIRICQERFSNYQISFANCYFDEFSAILIF